MVRVYCATYNHTSYIEDAMNGFCMQETTFPFVCTIIDDASTDGEPDIIKKYLQEHFKLDENPIARQEETDDYALTFARHRTNKNCFFAVLFLKYNHFQVGKVKTHYLTEWTENAKYVAVCEGDDYWTDFSKLQVQVDYMESHSECSLCFHDAIVYSVYKKTNIQKFFLPLKDRNYRSRHLFTKGWFIPTASILYRNDKLMLPTLYPEWAKKKGMGGDIKWQMFLSTQGYFHFIARKMSYYRFGTPCSATERSRKSGNQQSHQIYLDFLKDANNYLFDGKYTHIVYYKYFKLFLYRIIQKIKSFLV